MPSLSDYYFFDPRLVLIPIEHLSPAGMSGDFAALLREHVAWPPERVDLLNAAFSLYWERMTDLAARARPWPTPRLRHLGVVRDPLSVRPYSQLLNTSAWTLYECDLDSSSDPELVAYLLVHGDRMAILGEVTLAAVHNAPYWFERTDVQLDAFRRAAAASTRPDADAYRALADALVWVRQLHHETLRPPPSLSRTRAIQGTSLHVPAELESKPPALVEEWERAARRALGAYHARWAATNVGAVNELCRWLSSEAPPLLIGANRGPVVWDPATPDRIGTVRTLLRQGSGAAVRDVHADLEVIARKTNLFLASLVEPESLPKQPLDADQSGYSYMHRERRLVSYNLDEPGLERLQGPAIPYARAMLGARTVHEWAHLAVDAGWVPCRVPPEELVQHTQGLAAQLDEIIASAPTPLRLRAASDEQVFASGGSPGTALTRRLLTRMPDYQANLLAQRYLDLAERETYVRQNIRTLRFDYRPEHLWRMLARYIFEYQYLRFSALPDPRAYFLRSTWFDADFFATGTLDKARFDGLVTAVARICECYEVDESRFRPTSGWPR